MFLVMFLICEVSQTMSNQFEMLYEKVWKLNWYALPIKMQKIILISMANRRKQAVAIEGFGNIQWTRETFRQVLVR